MANPWDNDRVITPAPAARPVAPPQSPAPMAWSDVPGQAASNFLPSAKRFGGDMLEIVKHPIDTATNVAKLGMGLGEKLIPGDQGHEQYADAIGQFFADRYGGIDNLKRTMATDPVGFLADVSTVVTGGAALAAKLPGTAGRVAATVGNVAKLADPIQGTVAATKLLGKGVGKFGAAVLGTSTGAGMKPIEIAAKTGLEGGAAGQAFRDNMRQNVQAADVLGDVKTGLKNIKADRSVGYTTNMAGVKADPTVLDFTKIDQAVDKSRKVGTFTGKNSGVTISTSKSTADTMAKIDAVVDEWRAALPGDFHTPGGFDALKQSIGDIMDSTQYGTPSHKVATDVFNAIKEEIKTQAPEYSKAMKAYSDASDTIREIEQTLSQKTGASVDTQLRKLQSTMRDGVQTNYGQRVKLVEMLQDHGAKNILAKLAGQSLHSLTPRGLVGQGAMLGGGLWSFADPTQIPHMAAAAATTSPRFVGEAVHLGARLAKPISKIPLREALAGGYAVRNGPTIDAAERMKRDKAL